ncbi:fatty acid cis/trans isomerase [Aliiglaciecola sp. M165]|uniref:fatty acid cis/trans isomerase n=1 Tax=Aliiglaciecola sp. M165 TaxID=2593649 RepID=UPI001180D730|nr:fatty acid cis/trans isomerase [Aliiglaciecola sp. M165]TRY32945.1 fatty acid cis/trans isomerase [Aliiglaciecola sp. M165]
MNNRVSSIVIFILVTAVGGMIYFTYTTPETSVVTEQSASSNQGELDYQSSIKPIIETRCVVCHACYDAPCQLKLGSFEGLSRGASEERVYDGERLLEANLTRLFEDAHSTEAWREKGFFPVLNEKQGTASENLESSLFAQMLTLKKQNPLPQNKLLTEEFDLDLNRQHQCETIDNFESYKQDYALWGMPYGLPAISNKEHDILIKWIEKGAVGTDEVAIDADVKNEIEKWEVFFNQNSLKAQLMSRYLFEHLFLVNLHFSQNKPTQYFRLVRSSTPPGESIQGIFTRRPFDDPNVERVYYRIQQVKETIVHKSHMPMGLSDDRMARWKKLFIEADYQVTSLPSFEPKEASNPFVTFAQIPVQSRYKYMLDESQNTIMQFIKGPVCRGQMALNVINDHFWVLFAEPELDFLENDEGFMQRARQKIALPAEKQSNALPTSWLTYASMEREYLKAKSEFIEQNIANKIPITLDLLWDGDGNNTNAALTVFRHKDAASVVKGLVGNSPQTAWVLTYPLFERIHYLLVAGYDVFGNIGHQLNSRMYMDFLRMEGEFNFLSFLPEATREQVRQKWYRGSVSEVEKYVYEANEATVKTAIEFDTDDHLSELFQAMEGYLGSALSQVHNLENGSSSKEVLSSFHQINAMQGANVSFLPESAIIRVVNEENGKAHFYTMLRHSAHTNISHLFGEDDRRLPGEDTVTVASGFMTSHPNTFMQLSTREAPAFANAINNLSSAKDYENLMDDYGVRRTHQDFWQFADSMHNDFRQKYPRDFGYLDFNRLENR